MILENLNIGRFFSNLYQRMRPVSNPSTASDPLLTLWVAQEGTTPIRDVKMQETATNILLKISIPSLKPENLQIQVTSETVFLSGEQIEQVQVLGYCDFTYPAQQFQSLIPLPYPVHPETVTAILHKNVLVLTLPKQQSGSSCHQGIVVRCSPTLHQLSQALEVNYENS